MKARAAPWIALTALIAPTVILWINARPLSTRTVNAQATLGAVSSLAAVVGTALFAIAVVMSSRLAAIESLAGGLDRLYRLHHRIGSLAFVLVALHPGLLATRYAQSSWHRAAHLWRPTASDIALTSGQVALWVMTAGMVMTLYGRMRHQRLVWTQRVLGLMLVPGAWHAFRIGGDVGNYRPLRIYLGVLVALGLAALAYHTVLGRLMTHRYHYRLTRITPLAGRVTELRLQPVHRSLPFVPGQFGFLSFPDSRLGAEPHPFSIASGPDEPELRFVVKDLGDYTHRLGELDTGTRADIEGPYGRFSHRLVKNPSQIWIAGGIGIAPFLSMARALEPHHRVDLYYCVTDAGDAPFLTELAQLEAANPALRVRIVDERVDGFPTVEMIGRRSGPLADREVLICGPPRMNDALVGQLHAAGVRNDRIHYEKFDFV